MKRCKLARSASSHLLASYENATIAKLSGPATRHLIPCTTLKLGFII